MHTYISCIKYLSLVCKLVVISSNFDDEQIPNTRKTIIHYISTSRPRFCRKDVAENPFIKIFSVFQVKCNFALFILNTRKEEQIWCRIHFHKKNIALVHNGFHFSLICSVVKFTNQIKDVTQFKVFENIPHDTELMYCCEYVKLNIWV